jgi:hypothetical protein
LSRRVRAGSLGLAAAGALLSAAPARAGIIAAVDVPVQASTTAPCTQTDIALIDPATGARSAVPAGVNTPSDELHPSMTPDGRRMAFATVDPLNGTTRIRVVDMTTGQQADLFNAFDSATIHPTAPAISSDGATVATGGPLVASSSSQFSAVWNVSSLANFPGGPFARSPRPGNASFAAAGVTGAPDMRSDGVLVSEVETGGGWSLLISFANGLSSGASEGTSVLGDPTLSDPSTNVVVFARQQRTSAGTLGNSKLAFRPVSGFATAATVELPTIVNGAGLDQVEPSFTPDGRYLGFIRVNRATGDQWLLVFDTQTQTLLNEAGIYLGRGCVLDNRTVSNGGISLRETVTLTRSTITASGSLSFQLLAASGVGILVQRIVGHDRLLGRVVPTLKTVGRVPLGKFKRGRHHVSWNLRVNGRRLQRGSYLVTPRLVAHGVVTELGKPRVLQIG